MKRGFYKASFFIRFRAMLDKDLIQKLSTILEETVLEISTMPGGDISSIFKLKTPSRLLVIKLHNGELGHQILQSEKLALKTIASTKTIATPKIYSSGILDNKAYLVMECINSKTPTSDNQERLGHDLATLHKITSDNFGFIENNFIGSLPQSNTNHDNWIDFYINERLFPQLKTAEKKGLLNFSNIPQINTMASVCKELMPEVVPSLLHGDLWSGNFMIDQNGTPYLIDPSVYFGHNEVDIAMSKLFGGFSESFYEAYHRHFPKTQYFSERIQLYQLYYLLVHLNLFGRSYYPSVKGILSRIF
ncbi:fructosamine kinase family protein [Mangrovimonas aestuarii]|uniref:fructosamine kinase family protein n=1 Tax=Mangrovimonas aestuarii TaxID=3018443 RepID=UPI0023786A76|nr:fructosamine kinase family protein [Mangrovimonas aestuarii]